MFYHVDKNKPFYLYTDPSQVAIGGVLYQKDNFGNNRVVLYKIEFCIRLNQDIMFLRENF